MRSTIRLCLCLNTLVLLNGCFIGGDIKVVVNETGQTQFIASSKSEDRVCIKNISVSVSGGKRIWVAILRNETLKNKEEICEDTFLYGQKKQFFDTSDAPPLIKGKEYFVSFSDGGIKGSASFIAGQ
jgi:hypothetical protein